MKNSFETEVPRNTKATRRLAGTAALLLLGILVWAACSGLAAGIANETSGSPCRNDWYHRCLVEVRQLIAIANYVLTPEDDSGGDALFVGPVSPVLPALGGPAPVLATGSGHISNVPDNADRY